MDSYHAPAGRDLPEELQRRAALVENTPLLQTIMDALPTPALILNEKRQILAANLPFLQMFGVQAEEVIGRRTGEVAGCTYWEGGPDGCGTTRNCLTCGAVEAVLESQETQSRIVRECRLSLDTAINGGARDLRVAATAVDVNGEKLTVCTIEDISQQKRLAVLTRVFFHDVLNTAGGIQGYVRFLEADFQKNSTTLEDVRQLGSLARQLVDEIESQRDLTLAESGDLEVDPRPVRTVELLEDLRALYSGHTVAIDRKIRFAEIWDGHIVADPRLLMRVLGNMLKNALEATSKGGTVTVRCVDRGRELAFSVHNASVMPEEVKLQIFHRSFSTKADAGRGIGTYSMRLLGQQYLGGKVEFTSEEPEGTTFSIILPKVFARPTAS